MKVCVKRNCPAFVNGKSLAPMGANVCSNIIWKRLSVCAPPVGGVPIVTNVITVSPIHAKMAPFVIRIPMAQDSVANVHQDSVAYSAQRILMSVPRWEMLPHVTIMASASTHPARIGACANRASLGPGASPVMYLVNIILVSTMVNVCHTTTRPAIAADAPLASKERTARIISTIVVDICVKMVARVSMALMLIPADVQATSKAHTVPRMWTNAPYCRTFARMALPVPTPLVDSVVSVSMGGLGQHVPRISTIVLMRLVSMEPLVTIVSDPSTVNVRQARPAYCAI